MSVPVSIVAALILSLGSLFASAADMKITLPGTGVQIAAPDGMRIAPAGSALVEENGEAFIMFAMSAARTNPENDPTWRGVFPRLPERVATPAFTGRLYRRTRAADGGAWDGWMLVVPRGPKVLVVTAMYTGASNEVFEHMREPLMSVVWDETIADPELALGVKLTPQGLRVVPGVYGGLSYNETGEVGEHGRTLMVMPLPVPLSKVDALFPSGCETALAAAFRGKPFEGPTFVNRDGVRVCESWSKETDQEMRYIAMVRLPNGGILSAMGTASSSGAADSLKIFRDAVENLEPHPARSAQPQ